MPPTTSDTVGRLACERDALAAAMLAVAAAMTSAAAIESLSLRLNMCCTLLLVGLDETGLGGRRRPPGEEPLLELGDQPLGGEGDAGDDQHRREHAVRVESVLRRRDHESETALRAEDLADDRADDRESERDVETGDDPRQRRRDDDVADDLQARRAEHARVGDEVAIDLAHALERVEEDDEEHEHRRERDLRRRSEPEPNEEDRTEHDARKRVDDLDVRAEDIREEPHLTEEDAEHDSAGDAVDEPEQRLLHRHPDL